MYQVYKEKSLVMRDIFTLITPDANHAAGHLVGLDGRLLLPHTGLGTFRVLKVQSNLVRWEGGGVYSLKIVNNILKC